MNRSHIIVHWGPASRPVAQLIPTAGLMAIERKPEEPKKPEKLPMIHEIEEFELEGAVYKKGQGRLEFFEFYGDSKKLIDMDKFREAFDVWIATPEARTHCDALWERRFAQWKDQHGSDQSVLNSPDKLTLIVHESVQEIYDLIHKD